MGGKLPLSMAAYLRIGHAGLPASAVHKMCFDLRIQRTVHFIDLTHALLVLIRTKIADGRLR